MVYKESINRMGNINQKKEKKKKNEGEKKSRDC